jgi:hypothetical protein
MRPAERISIPERKSTETMFDSILLDNKRTKTILIVACSLTILLLLGIGIGIRLGSQKVNGVATRTPSFAVEFEPFRNLHLTEEKIISGVKKNTRRR